MSREEQREEESGMDAKETTGGQEEQEGDAEADTRAGSFGGSKRRREDEEREEDECHGVEEEEVEAGDAKRQRRDVEGEEVQVVEVERKSVWFAEAGKVEVVEERVKLKVGRGKVLVETTVSAISSGTEMKVFLGEAGKLCAEENIEALQTEDGLEFPVQYGYCVVGVVVAVGKGVSKMRTGTRVFAFHPHESHFVACAEALQVVPDGVEDDDAVFLANMETALCLVHKGRPQMGEQVAVFGQGIIGLLLTDLLTRFHLTSLVTVDGIEQRRQYSLNLGATHSVGVDKDGCVKEVLQCLQGEEEAHACGADLTFEVSGNSKALDNALRCTGKHGRVVIGSFYGENTVPLHLGAKFHRSHMHLCAAQVSEIPGEMMGRWTKKRRLQTVWELLAVCQPSKLISHRVAVSQAGEAYDMLRTRQEEAVQVVLEYTTG